MTPLQIISHYLKKYPKESDRLGALCQQAAHGEPLWSRKTMPGHLTASAIVMTADKLLLIYHPFLQKWIQPGGHLEEGETAFMAAKRELLEETGVIAELHPWHEGTLLPFDIDIHFIPANEKKGEEAHFHYDCRYIFTLQEGSFLESSPELACSWQKLDQVEEPNLKRLLQKWHQRKS